jgi:hypothetical protein
VFIRRLIFPQYGVIVITFSIFLWTYTYIEACSNHHPGSIPILAYVLVPLRYLLDPPFRFFPSYIVGSC